MRGQHLLHRAEGLAPELARYFVRAARVRIDHSQQPHRLPLLFQFLVDSGMVASENAHAHDGDGDRTLRWQEKFSMAGCRKQIVNGIPGKSIWISAGCRRAVDRFGSSRRAGSVCQEKSCARHTLSSRCGATTNQAQPWKSGPSRAAQCTVESDAGFSPLGRAAHRDNKLATTTSANQNEHRKD